jgi:hypothetical protein
MFNEIVINNLSELYNIAFPFKIMFLKNNYTFLFEKILFCMYN